MSKFTQSFLYLFISLAQLIYIFYFPVAHQPSSWIQFFPDDFTFGRSFSSVLMLGFGVVGYYLQEEKLLKVTIPKILFAFGIVLSFYVFITSYGYVLIFLIIGMAIS